ncbi:MAG: ABC transporter permease [Actinobacteria bacterium]|nr:MAG: ABC transporter permease [Actinomycetota bacterium]
MALKLDYVARETAINLKRNLLMTSAAILTVAVSLGLVGGALLLRQGVQNATVQWKGGVELSIFMKPDVTSEQMSAIEHQLRAMPEVKRVRFVSKDAAYAEFKKLFANSPDMVETVTPDNLPPSFRVVPKAAEQVESIGEPFRNRPGVYRVVYAEKQVKTLLKVTRALQLGILVIALVLLASASVLILNTIRMAIFARRREVAVMKLVGATNWFIRVPFMFEGLLQGLVGAGVAFAAVYLGRNLVQDAVRHNELFHQFYVSSAEVVGTGLFIVIVGALVGGVGSAVAVTRFLDV